jgi:type IV secretory pathway TraG/TraD family ATPase VirD4
LEASHILFMGDTGSGKSSAIRQLLRQVKDRGESAIVYDPAMDFLGEFYDPKRGDLILNPLDQRCPYWGLGDEIDRPETATTIAAAMLPDKDYEKAFFTDAPRRVLAHLLRRKPQPRDILRMMADPESIEAAVKGTPLAALLDPGAPAQRAGVLSSLNMVADSLELLPEWEHTRGTFATAEWYTERKRWVFLTSSAAYRQKVLPLHSAWLDLFILRMMGYCEDQVAKPVWFVIDELASLNKLPQLHTAVTENRKYGNPVVMGIQGRSQMEKRYGQDAEAMLSQPATKIFLKTSEPRAAKWISEAIGEIEVERLKESRSMGLLRSKKSFALEIATKPLVMASEIAGLAPLSGFIKLENHVVRARFRLAKKRNRQPEFLERAREQPLPRRADAVKTADAVNVPEAKKPVQAVLPLEETPVVKKEGFSWDESKGIE